MKKKKKKKKKKKYIKSKNNTKIKRKSNAKAIKKFAQVKLCSVKLENPSRKYIDGNHATEQNEPHQRAALLHVVDHPKLIDELRPACKN